MRVFGARVVPPWRGRKRLISAKIPRGRFTHPVTYRNAKWWQSLRALRLPWRFVVMPASGPGKAPAPVVYFAGGP